MNVSRRKFISGAALAAGSTAFFPGVCGLAQDAVDDAPRRSGVKNREKVAWQLTPFSMADVRLRSGPMLKAMEINQRYLHSLPNDRLLYTFRTQAGLGSTAQPFGGWEDPKCELRGHFAGGHYLSACALMYASNDDGDLLKKANALVAELAKCQASDGYLSAFPQEFFVRLRNGQKVWAPFYTYHKIMAGHVDMYVHGGNEQGLQTAEKMAGWVADYLHPIADAQWREMQKVEFGGMNEVMYNLYAITGKEQYLALGKRFDDPAIFNPLVANEDKLSGHHANTNIPKIIGAARAYELTGDSRYRKIAETFWHEVTTNHAYCTGGTSNDEFWQDPGKLSAELGPAAEECCCGYNMLKLTRHLHGWTGDPRYMDYYERVLYNSRLGTQDAQGMLMYYLPLKPGMWKTFGTAEDSFWCCTGTGVEEYSKTNDSIYSHDAQSIYVNLFIGSQVNWKEKGIRLTQNTLFPDEQGTTITIQTERLNRIPLHIRVPYWATRDVAILVNGKPEPIPVSIENYVKIDRQWNTGDRVEVRLPMHLHSAPLPDDPTLQAGMFGPMVLASRLGSEGLTQKMTYGNNVPEPSAPAPPMPRVVAKNNGIESWISKKQGDELAFETIGQPETMVVIPLYQLFNERYSVYWKVDSSGEPANDEMRGAATAS